MAHCSSRSIVHNFKGIIAIFWETSSVSESLFTVYVVLLSLTVPPWDKSEQGHFFPQLMTSSLLFKTCLSYSWNIFIFVVNLIILVIHYIKISFLKSAYNPNRIFFKLLTKRPRSFCLFKDITFLAWFELPFQNNEWMSELMNEYAFIFGSVSWFFIKETLLRAHFGSTYTEKRNIASR